MPLQQFHSLWTQIKVIPRTHQWLHLEYLQHFTESTARSQFKPKVNRVWVAVLKHLKITKLIQHRHGRGSITHLKTEVFQLVDSKQLASGTILRKTSKNDSFTFSWTTNHVSSVFNNILRYVNILNKRFILKEYATHQFVFEWRDCLYYTVTCKMITKN